MNEFLFKIIGQYIWGTKIDIPDGVLRMTEHNAAYTPKKGKKISVKINDEISKSITPEYYRFGPEKMVADKVDGVTYLLMEIPSWCKLSSRPPTIGYNYFAAEIGKGDISFVFLESVDYNNKCPVAISINNKEAVIDYTNTSRSDTSRGIKTYQLNFNKEK